MMRCTRVLLHDVLVQFCLMLRLLVFSVLFRDGAGPDFLQPGSVCLFLSLFLSVQKKKLGIEIIRYNTSCSLTIATGVEQIGEKIGSRCESNTNQQTRKPRVIFCWSAIYLLMERITLQ